MAATANRPIIYPILEVLDGVILGAISSLCYNFEEKNRPRDNFFLARKIEKAAFALLAIMAIVFPAIGEWGWGFLAGVLLLRHWLVFSPKVSANRHLLKLDRALAHRWDSVSPTHWVEAIRNDVYVSLLVGKKPPRWLELELQKARARWAILTLLGAVLALLAPKAGFLFYYPALILLFWYCQSVVPLWGKRPADVERR